MEVLDSRPEPSPKSLLVVEGFRRTRRGSRYPYIAGVCVKHGRGESVPEAPQFYPTPQEATGEPIGEPCHKERV